VKAMAQPPEFKNFIAGDWVSPATGEYFENRNPADWNDVIGRFPRSGPDALQHLSANWRGRLGPLREAALGRRNGAL